MERINSNLLKELIKVRGTSGDESRIKDFILTYIEENKANWKSPVTIYEGENFQDAIVLVFGQPKTAVFAHIDTIGYMVGYNNSLMKIGSPANIDTARLVGSDSKGKIETELMVMEHPFGQTQLKCLCEREIDRGTILTYKPRFIQKETYIQSPYLDNRLGVLNALHLAEGLENGAIVFSTYEEHGGGSVGFLAKFLFEKYGTRQALISDITWVTDGIKHGEGVVISMRDQHIPRRSYLNQLIAIAKENNIKFQLEVESAGGSDGSYLQKSNFPFDWCFVGAPESNAHTPKEKVYISDIVEMMKFYEIIMNKIG